MPIIRHGPRRFRAVIFDLDETLLARTGAWSYAIEESIVAVTGRRLAARELAAEYHSRPWRHALAVLLDDQAAMDRCEALCCEMFQRSAMKRLLVHEGMGMALDHVRAERVEMGAISREPHVLARRQIESTGLERFIAVLSATPQGVRWDVSARMAECQSFLECDAKRVAYVSGDGYDLRAAETAGATPIEAGWAGGEPTGYPRIERPADLGAFLAL
ncbi:MAG: HAD family hydrolase [Chloroflexi bacterium]|nr:HAD family hydrolase [Chloroflexota bacterium]